MLVFVDPRRFRGRAVLYASAVRPGVVRLNPRHDGISQIARVVAGAPELRAIVVMAGDGDAGIVLGATVLRRDMLDSHSLQLQSIGRALGPAGVILLSARADAALVRALAMHTGIRVVAVPREFRGGSASNVGDRRACAEASDWSG